MIGPSEVTAAIVNLEECADGVYQVVICNESRDWESGIIDAYDYRLVPYVPAENDSKLPKKLVAIEPAEETTLTPGYANEAGTKSAIPP